MRCTLEMLEKPLKTVSDETCPFTGRTSSKTFLSCRHIDNRISVYICLNPLFLRPFFWRYLNPQVRIDKMVDKHLKQWLAKPQRYIFSYFYQLLEFSLKPVYFTMVGKNFHFYGVQISRKCIEPMHFYAWPPPQWKVSTKFLSLLSPQAERNYYFPPRKCFFENLFPRQQMEIISDCNWTQTHNHFVDKGTLNHLAKFDQFRKVVECSFMN